MKTTLLESTTTGATTPGGHVKPIGIIKRPITTSTTTGCPCKNLPGKVVCGICGPKRK